MIRCHYCGTDNLDGTEYCDECGIAVSTSPQPSQTSSPKRDSSINWRSWLSKVAENAILLLVLPFIILFIASRKVIKSLHSIVRGKENSQPVSPIASPFTTNFGRHEITVPLTRLFRYGHEPVGADSPSRFVGRQNELDVLTQRILFSNGGSFLVTGYRGVGKTSFVNQVVSKLKAALPWAQPLLKEMEIVDVPMNIARPVQPGELMHHIIRRLYDELLEKGIYQLLDEGLKEDLTLAYQRTSVNVARKMAEASERTFGFNEASIGGELLKATVKASWMAKRSRTQNYEMTFLGYDDKAAEHDIIRILQRLTKGYAKPIRWSRMKQVFNRTSTEWVKLKIVFVFDELDKLEEFIAKVEGKGEGEQKPVIDVILGTLKNLFTTSGVTFVFIAGKDLQERWLEDVGKGDSIYESVFSYDKYLPCLWADVGSICDGLVDLSQPTTQSKYQVFNEFKKYLAYKGRGIPRRIIRTFNEYVEWDSDQPMLAFTGENVRNIRFFAGLQDVLTTHEDQLFGDSHEEVVGTQSDKRRLGVYYLVDWILCQGAAEFRLNDVLSASERLSTKIALAQKIVSGVAADIIKILLNADYLQEVQKPLDRVFIDDVNVEEEKRYRLAPRRLVEMGKPAVDVEVDASFDWPTKTIFPASEQRLARIGKYKIIRTIGRGGMGVVYQATDVQKGRNVAIKIPHLDVANADLLARFEREAMIMDELSHSNIIRLYDWGKDDGKLYIAMEYLDGLTLEKIIDKEKKLDLDLVIAIAMPVAKAIHYIHKKGFVRNDIKPSNIMLTMEGRVCLFDFGITKPLTSKAELHSKFETKSGGVIGTIQFMAPEQFHGFVDERSDIYSLGVVLYTMLTGVYPFDRSVVEDVMRASMEDTVEPPSQQVSLPTEMDELILKCLNKDPDRRFQTMDELATALTTVKGDWQRNDLKSFVNGVREEIEDIEEMDRADTRRVERRVPLSIDASASPDTTLLRLPKSLEMSDIAPSEAGPYIVLFRGRKEDVDFHVTIVGGYLLKKKTTIGRSSENNISLNDVKVSRYHAEFTIDGEDCFIEDFNSSQGTFVNGEKIITRKLLADKDEIQISDFVFIFNQAVGVIS